MTQFAITLGIFDIIKQISESANIGSLRLEFSFNDFTRAADFITTVDEKGSTMYKLKVISVQRFDKSAKSAEEKSRENGDYMTQIPQQGDEPPFSNGEF